MGKLKDLLIGDYDWQFLCTPRTPWGKRKPAPPLYGPDDPISIFVALIMGAQHALAMVGGIITVPLIISGAFQAGFTMSEQSYLISAALIVSGFASLVQVLQIKVPFTNIVIGSGLLSVMGISFTFLPIAQSSIAQMKSCSCDGAPCTVGGTCLQCTGKISGICNTGEDAYGRLLGTILVTCFLEIGLSFCPPKVLRKIFPPVVTGTTVILIGIALLTTGFQYWGGGVYCAGQVLTSMTPCDGNGEVVLPFGSRQYLGLGLSVFMTLLFVELFGSPFLRNIMVVVGLMVGMIVASATHYTDCSATCADPVCSNHCFPLLPEGLRYNNVTGAITGTATFSSPNSTYCTSVCAAPVCGPVICKHLHYVTGAKISDAKWVTFLWVHTFKIGFYAPAVLPMLFGFMVTTMECIGDVTATAEASGLVPVGERYEKAVRGGVLADGCNIFLSALGTSLPCTTYAQNNGVISLTRCGARRAGIACAIILIVLGVIAKFSAIILTIPDCVLGGMTSFLFVNVAVSGMRILTMGEGITRRNRFIIAMALAIGIGVDLVPEWVNISGQSEYPREGNFWPFKAGWSSGYRGFRDALIIVLSTGFSIGGFMALILNLILPHDLSDDMKLHDTAFSTGTMSRENETLKLAKLQDEDYKEAPVPLAMERDHHAV
eukprot:SM000066S20454  [mRNA]  locus=s66:480443:485518:- [translate_table: standard]